MHGWRIVPEHRRDVAFTGEGARRFGARWNSPGNAVVYLSEHRSLAALEVMVQRRADAELTRRFWLFEATWDESLAQRLSVNALPAGWRDQRPANRVTVALGDAWLKAGRSAVLIVPSAIIPEEHNILLNPSHVDYPKVAVGQPVAFAFDSRLLN